MIQLRLMVRKVRLSLRRVRRTTRRRCTRVTIQKICRRKFLRRNETVDLSDSLTRTIININIIQTICNLNLLLDVEQQRQQNMRREETMRRQQVTRREKRKIGEIEGKVTRRRVHRREKIRGKNMTLVYFVVCQRNHIVII